jgi:6-phosphogluconolactonase
MIKKFSSESEFIETVASEIRASILKKTSEGKIFRLALSGGSTPGPIYRRLAEQDIPWDQVEVYLVDERYVPLDHPHSNYHMIRETLLDHVNPKKVVYFDTSLPIEDSLKKYESRLDPSQNDFFDLVLLGVGTDGHTASLFPNSPALEEKERWVAHATTDQFDVRDRLTLTFPALESSYEQFFLVKNKMEILERIKSQDQTLPATRIAQKPNTLFYVSN